MHPLVQGRQRLPDEILGLPCNPKRRMLLYTPGGYTVAISKKSRQQLTAHHEQIPYLKKIEGQVRGIMRMIDDERYCVDIITQLQAVVGALGNVQDAILKKHLEGCVTASMRSAGQGDQDRKVQEVLDIIKKLRR